MFCHDLNIHLETPELNFSFCGFKMVGFILGKYSYAIILSLNSDRATCLSLNSSFCAWPSSENILELQHFFANENTGRLGKAILNRCLFLSDNQNYYFAAADLEGRPLSRSEKD